MPGKCAAVALGIFLLFSQGNVLAQQQPLKLGVHPYLASSELVRRFTPLAEYLSAVLKRPVILELSNSYNTHIQKIGNDMVHIAFMGPASYVIMTDQFGRKPILAALESNGKSTFRGVIVTKRDSTITSLRQLKGKKFAFADRDSTMGHLVPRHMLLQRGVDLKDFATSMNLANHDNIALAVLAGDFDAGAVKEEIFLKYRPEGLRAVAFTPDIADHLFVASSLLPRQTVQAIRSALLDLNHHPDGRRIMHLLRADISALMRADDGSYDNLREIIRDLKRAGVEP
ncbi:MAG: hypothetical protein A2010_16525 [Nitrospirae bacterium GWD2_57_9]|nr:MAG: hypothetical protein A2010_16525 [Nitrospirae bacterium GWD2_57_9]OGW48452.1 MAG: hypothetical protein A2078_10005 [Nitrospirae bacterium GWC2_57_9]